MLRPGGRWNLPHGTRERKGVVRLIGRACGYGSEGASGQSDRASSRGRGLRRRRDTFDLDGLVGLSDDVGSEPEILRAWLAATLRDGFAITATGGLCRLCGDGGDAGRWKPAPETYAYAAGQCEDEPGEMALVAVHPWDIDGAHRSGLRTGWISRAGDGYPSFMRAGRDRPRAARARVDLDREAMRPEQPVRRRQKVIDGASLSYLHAGSGPPGAARSRHLLEPGLGADHGRCRRRRPRGVRA